jgi:conjugal transfer/entry exclusion protein
MTPQEMEAAIARLFEGQDMLTGKVAELTDDVSELSTAVKAMREEWQTERQTLRDEAAADRAVQREAIEEMRTAVSSMLDIAESMASNVTLLTQAQQRTSQRLDLVEKRVNQIEGGLGPTNGERDE